MRGECLNSAHLGFGGVYGDRRYAFRDTCAREDFPWLTSREKHTMLLHRALYRHPEEWVRPNGHPSAARAVVDVETPDGELLAIDDPRLIELLRSGLRERHEISLTESEIAVVDSRPISLLSLQTAAQLSVETGIELDKRRFRANIYVDLVSGRGFGEDELVGGKLAMGEAVVVEILKRNKRCKVITLDPDSVEPCPGVMQRVARDHEMKVGIYAAVLIEGTVFPGDEIRLIQ
jgi:uncharacterized protein YcbX